MKLGMSWPGPEIGARADAAGAAAFSAGEFADYDAYLSVAEMAMCTSRARLGTGIAYAFSRTPFAHAAALRHLSRMAPDRLFVALGSGAYRINRDWFGAEAGRPVARLAECIQVLRSFLLAENGERVRFDGEFYSIDANVRAPVLGRLDIPILVGAFNAGTLAMAGRVADGIVGHDLFTAAWWQQVVRPALGQGRAQSDLPQPPLEYGRLLVAIDDEEPERARMDVRRMIAFELTVKTYDKLVDFHGWARPVAGIREAFGRDDVDAMASAVTDEMVTAIALVGTTTEVRAALAGRDPAGLPADLAFLSPPGFMVGRRRRTAYAQASLALL